MQGKSAVWVLVMLAVGAGAAYWYLQERAMPPSEVLPAPAPLPEPAVPSGPRYPVPIAPADKPEVQALPSLGDSDEYLRLDVSRVFGADIASLLVNQALIERLVATIDNLPRSQLAARIRPVKPLPSSFVAVGQDESGEFDLGVDNFQRYDAWVAELQAVDVAQIVELYRRYYPLFQKAYEGLGYPNGYFNDRLVEVLDHLLATPNPGGNVTLVRPHVLYEFADDDLQSLSSGQKLLIRMGPAHRGKVLAVIRAFRDKVATE